MYNKLCASYKKKNIYNFEDEPPEKKLISDGDILIKQLAEKQRNTETNLEEQLSLKKEFYKATEFVSLTKYTSGTNTLEEFNSITKFSDEMEKLKTFGLTNDEIELYFDNKKGTEYLKAKHKNINEVVITAQLKEISRKIQQSNDRLTKAIASNSRLKTETVLSTKPSSVETKLLKFALENQQTHKEKLPDAMDNIKDIEAELNNDLAPVNIKKIRKKARNLSKQINAIDVELKEPLNVRRNNLIAGNSKWDLKEEPQSDSTHGIIEKKLYSCKPQNYYTIKNGEIVKINFPQNGKTGGSKLSLEEIKKIPKFENYDPGIPSKILYLKNLPNNVTEDELKQVFSENKEILSIKIMKGRMRGQAFIEFENEAISARILNEFNGIILKNKPIIIQFGKHGNQ